MIYYQEHPEMSVGILRGGPVRDLSGDGRQPGAGRGVVDREVLLGHVRQALEVDKHISPVPVNTRDLDVALEISGVQPAQRKTCRNTFSGEVGEEDQNLP